MAAKSTKKSKHQLNTVDLYGNAVHCTAERWTTHIIEPLDGHPEMTGREADVAQAIADPDKVRPSTLTGKARAFELVTAADTVRVIVTYQDPTTIDTGRTYGWVTTAYPEDPSYPSNVGAPIYVKPKKGGA